MRDANKQLVLYGIVATVLGAILIGLAALWKNAVINRTESTDGVVASSAVDALLVGGLVILGMLCVIAAVALFLFAWWRNQGRDDETIVSVDDTPEALDSSRNGQPVQPTATAPSADPNLHPDDTRPLHPTR